MFVPPCQKMPVCRQGLAARAACLGSERGSWRSHRQPSGAGGVILPRLSHAGAAITLPTLTTRANKKAVRGRRACRENPLAGRGECGKCGGKRAGRRAGWNRTVCDVAAGFMPAGKRRAFQQDAIARVRSRMGGGCRGRGAEVILAQKNNFRSGIVRCRLPFLVSPASQT